MRDYNLIANFYGLLEGPYYDTEAKNSTECKSYADTGNVAAKFRCFEHHFLILQSRYRFPVQSYVVHAITYVIFMEQ